MTQSDRQRAQEPESQSDTRYLDQANRGQLLLQRGHVDAALRVFEATLADVGEAPSYSRAVILERLGRCLLAKSQPLQAAALLQQSMDLTETLPVTDGIKSLQGVLQSGLGDAFHAAGDLGEARKAYEAALAMAESLNDVRAQGVDLDHLGTLALEEGRLNDALGHAQKALHLFQQIGEHVPEAVAWHHLGLVFEATQEWDEADRHYREAARIRATQGDLAGAAQSLSQLATANAKSGRFDNAERWYRQAVEATRRVGHPILLRRHLINLANFLQNQPDRIGEAGQLASEALDSLAPETYAPDIWDLYGLLADIIDKDATRAADESGQAIEKAQARNYRHIQRYGPRLQDTLSGLGTEPTYSHAVIMERLGRCFLMGGRPMLAAAFLREAQAITDKLAPSELVTALQGGLHWGLGDALREAGDLDESRKAHEAAVQIAEDLGDLRAQGLNLDCLGKLALADNRPEDALATLQQAFQFFRKVGDRAAEATALHHLGVAFEETQEWNEAEQNFAAAAHLRDELNDVAAAALSRARLAELRGKTGKTDDASEPSPPRAATPACPTPRELGSAASPLSITIHDDVATDCAFDTDLLVDIGRAHKIWSCAETAERLPADVRPILMPRARAYLDEDGAFRFCLPTSEPDFDEQPHCVVMRKTQRDVAVAGNLSILWSLIRSMDGTRTHKEIVSALPTEEQPTAQHLLSALASTGVIDVSGRPIGRFIHAVTKKGVLLGGGLERDDVLRLATDGDYRAYPGASHIGLSEDVPNRLHGFHALTRARRSRREYAGQPLCREDFDALLHTACGVTGTMPWEGRELKLRAYPSSGALYAVEIYPVVLRVDGLEPGVYHYAAGENKIEAVTPEIELNRIIAAALPVERQMVSGAAVMICLVGQFRRHERKYGEGGYRMMVAEAGHISENLVLTATALGLTARPFGGVFDGLINRDLGLDETEEQFLLSVLVGHAAGIDEDGARETEPEGET